MSGLGARGVGVLLLTLLLLSSAYVSLTPLHGAGVDLLSAPDEVPMNFVSMERTMSGGRAWQGNVKARLDERVRARGFASLTAFAEARPAVPLYLLAEELGGDDVAAVQVLSGLLAEAEQRKQVTRFVRDVLVREMADSLPDGWPAVLDDASRGEVAMALGTWTAYTPTTHEERVKRAGDALLATPPPAGWRPLGPDDELLLSLLPDKEG